MISSTVDKYIQREQKYKKTLEIEDIVEMTSFIIQDLFNEYKQLDPRNCYDEKDFTRMINLKTNITKSITTCANVIVNNKHREDEGKVFTQTTKQYHNLLSALNKYDD